MTQAVEHNVVNTAQIFSYSEHLVPHAGMPHIGSAVVVGGDVNAASG